MNNKKQYFISSIYLAIFIWFIIYAWICCDYKTFWFDESFTIALVKHSFSSIWNFTATDVHPPLYYWMLKVFSAIFGHDIYIYRLFSALPFCIIIVLSYTSWRKIWGNKIILVFLVIMLTHSSMMYPVYDIRMYSWSMFFVLLAYIHAYKYYHHKRKTDLVFYILFSVCCLYTHYYALLAAFFIQAWLIISTGIYKRELFKYAFIGSIITLIAYAPWIQIMAEQVSAVSDSYWIPNINYDSLIVLLNPLYRKIYLIVVIGIFALLVAYSAYKDRTKNNVLKEGLILIMLAFMPIMAGVVISLIMRPIFFDRYMYCSILLLFLGIAQLVSVLDLKKVYNTIFILLVLYATTSESISKTKQTLREHSRLDTTNDQIDAFIEQTLDKDSYFLYQGSDGSQFGTYAIKYPDNGQIRKKAELPTAMQLYDLVPHSEIGSLDMLTPEHHRIFYIDITKSSFFTNKSDSLKLLENYAISRDFSISYLTAYELIRK